MIEAHLPAWLIVVPLLAAPLCVVVRQPRLAYAVCQVTTLTTLAVAVGLLGQVVEHGALSYALGGWIAPWGIEYRIDPLNGFVAVIISVIAVVVMLYAPTSVEREIPARARHYFYSAYLLCFTGLLGFNIFVFLEISSLAMYVLVGLGRDRRALMAAYQYLILGSIGGTFILIGVGLLYMMTGTLNIVDLADKIEPVLHSRTVLAAFAFLTVGTCLKLALFPLHVWLPNAYTYAPSVVSAFVSATATKVMVYVFVRFVFGVFGTAYAFGTLQLGLPLMGLALLGIYVASTIAIFQTNIKRMLAWSSIAQIGYMMLGIGLASVAGLTAGIVHLFNHALMKGGLFLVMGAVVFRKGATAVWGARCRSRWRRSCSAGCRSSGCRSPWAS